MTTLTPKQRVMLSLDGLSIGDAFGENFFGNIEDVLPRIGRRELPERVWPYTDDTEMALSIVRILLEYDGIHQDALARLFADGRVLRGPSAGAHRRAGSLEFRNYARASRRNRGRNRRGRGCRPRDAGARDDSAARELLPANRARRDFEL